MVLNTYRDSRGNIGKPVNLLYIAGIFELETIRNTLLSTFRKISHAST